MSTSGANSSPSSSADKVDEMKGPHHRAESEGGKGGLLRDDAPNELVVIDLSVPARHTSQGSVPLFDPLFLEPSCRGKGQHRETLDSHRRDPLQQLVHLGIRHLLSQLGQHVS